MSISLFNLREEERRPTLLGFLNLFGLMTAHSVMETARDTLFLNELSAEALP